jgi:hypothetical protein
VISITHQPLVVYHGFEHPTEPKDGNAPKKKEPLLYTSYRIDDDILYMSDVSSIPPEAMEYLKSPKVLVIDTLDASIEKPHPSHFSILQALECAYALKPTRTYITGFGHNESARPFQAILNGDKTLWGDHTAHEKHLKVVRDKVRGLVQDLDVKLAYDGLCVTISQSGLVRDDDD